MINEAIDFYDDPNGEILRSHLPHLDNVPEFIKTAERLTPEEIDKLPDDVFALVAFDGGQKMRKFACVDKGNVALSVLYFMENKDLLPEEAQKVAAANLMTACSWYDLEPPEDLEKIAVIGALLSGGMAVAQGNSDFKKRQALLNQGVPGSRAMSGGVPKMSELYGSQEMPVSSQAKEKKASLDPYVDITNQSVPVCVIPPQEAKYYCLVKEGQAKYPIDTALQVQQASAYFLENRDRFSPSDRHHYCVKLASRASDLGLCVPDVVKDYGSKGYSPQVKVAVFRRMRHFREGTSEHSLLDEMMSKHASIRPEVFAVALENFDRRTGMDRLWDAVIPDPYASTFGFTKVAEWSFTHGNETVNEGRLKACAAQCREDIEKKFGEDMAEEFAKNPIQIFDSMPLDSKRIIMRVAGQLEE
jgi:hypothetical protein